MKHRDPNQIWHLWINWPDKSHKKCLKCGCLYSVRQSKGKNIFCYEKDGEKYDHFINCIEK